MWRAARRRRNGRLTLSVEEGPGHALCEHVPRGFGRSRGIGVGRDAPGARAQVPAHPLDDKLANTPAPWTVPGKWGTRGNWGRWGEQDKRGMLNFITPEMIVKAAALVKQGKVYPLGEEMHSDLPRVITPSRFGVQIIRRTTDTIG